MLLIDRALLDRLGDICRAAGAEILTVYASDFAVDDKSDGSPLTAADQAAEAVILPALAAPTGLARGGSTATARSLWRCAPPTPTKG